VGFGKSRLLDERGEGGGVWRKKMVALSGPTSAYGAQGGVNTGKPGGEEGKKTNHNAKANWYLLELYPRGSVDGMDWGVQGGNQTSPLLGQLDEPVVTEPDYGGGDAETSCGHIVYAGGRFLPTTTGNFLRR